MSLQTAKQVSEAGSRPARGPVIPFVLAIFLGAFLIFQIQPMIARYILPWFGGGTEIWTTCMLFFQVLLLGGYSYAHFTTSRLKTGLQWKLHLLLLTAALVPMAVLSPMQLKPDSSQVHPTLQILTILATYVGLPYFVLSSTGPLLQAWFARLAPGASPYWLYALSNTGSLLALLSYPVAVEPLLSRSQQLVLWYGSLVAFVVVCGYCAVKLGGCAADLPEQPAKALPANEAKEKKSAKPAGKHKAAQPAAETSVPASVNYRLMLLWLALPAAASLELLATTSRICQDVGAIPFLWIIPLVIYLLSFIVCFHSERWYKRPVFLGLFILSLVAVCLAPGYASYLSALQLIMIYSFIFAVCCMVCHGELFRLRPDVRHLTRYYLMISAGGAVGGICAAVVAPLVFNSYLELELGLLACTVLVFLADKNPRISRNRKLLLSGLLLGAGAAFIVSKGQTGGSFGNVIYNSRNFYGVLTISKKADPPDTVLMLHHGTTVHGLQFTQKAKKLQPTTYYGPRSGVGLAINSLPAGNRRIGLVGLGVGTLASYGRAGDTLRIYEINPAVRDLAERFFAYLPYCPAKIETVMGDARLSLEKEQASGQLQQFDLLALDAFNSDTVPYHLLTTEAMETYFQHLKPGGILAVHVSARHVHLQPVVWKLAEQLKLNVVLISSEFTEAERKENGQLESDWLLLSREKASLGSPAIQQASSGQINTDGVSLWTDDHIDLLQVLK